MRLTLRTLLAYMDDILEPADHEDLGKKIEASDFATELIHRSRDTVRRLRLSAPAVLATASDDLHDGPDMGDANSVAEYLDNTLPPEQVADFERMCLEQGAQSDMHLAEVASCHHVLTMVLGEPAEVDADLKKRMYQLPAQLASGQKLRIEPAHVATPAATPEPPASVPTSPPTPPTTTASAQPEVRVAQSELPDYLQAAVAAKRRTRIWAIATTLFLGCCAIGYWFATAPEAEPPAEIAQGDLEEFGSDLDLDIDFGGDDLNTDAVVETDTTGDADLTASTTRPPSISGTTNSEAIGPPPAFTPGAAADTAAKPETDGPPKWTPSVVEIKPAETKPAETAPAETAAPITTEQPDLTTVEPAPETSSELPATAVETITELPELPTNVASEPGSDTKETPEPVRVASLPGDVDPIDPGSATKDASGAKEASDTESTIAEPAGPQRLGNYLGNNDMLLIRDAVSDQWVRLAPRSPISTGDDLLTLPRFYTHVVLADVNTYMSGGTRLRTPMKKFEAATTDANLSFEVVYGRVLLNAGLQGSQVAVQVGDQLREFRLGSSSSLAVEVERVFVPGSDYENEAAGIKATWYLTEGSAEWPTASGGTQTVEASSVWQTIDGIDEIPERLEKLPEWIGQEPMTSSQRSAREDLSRELNPSQSVKLRLLELTDGKGLGRKKEVRRLAAAASLYVGEFEPLVKALNDLDQRNAWETHINELRQAMALSPDVATKVRQALVDTRGAEAADELMQMIVGYNREQIGTTREEVQEGALSDLIKRLDHESLDYRVLAIRNIRDITGVHKGYRPDEPARRRKVDMRKFWDLLESNELLKRP